MQRLAAVFHAHFGLALRNFYGAERAESLVDLCGGSVHGCMPVGVVVAGDDHEASAVAFDFEHLRVHLGACDQFCITVRNAAFGFMFGLFRKDYRFAVVEVVVYRFGLRLCGGSLFCGSLACSAVCCGFCSCGIACGSRILCGGRCRFFGLGFADGRLFTERPDGICIVHRYRLPVDVGFAHGRRDRHERRSLAAVEDDGANVHQVEERMGGIGVVDVQEVVCVLLAAAELAVACKFVIVETVGVAQVELREGVSPERLVARKRKHARRIEGIRLVRRLERAYDGVVRLQVFVCGNVLDERAVDEEQLYRGGNGEDACLVGDGSVPAEDEQRKRYDDEDEYESRNHRARSRIHDDFVEGLEVRAGDRVGEQVLPAHEEGADGGKPEYDAGFYNAVRTGQLGLVGVQQVRNRKRLALVVEVHHADAGDAVHDAGDKPDRSDERGPVVASNDDEQQEDGEHHGAVCKGAHVANAVGGFIGNGAEYGTRHHHEQQRQPEQCHARCAEVLDAGENGIPELEER